MAQINYGGFPSVDVLFDENAKLVDPASPGRVTALCAAEGVTDLFVVSHGWNNNIPEAMQLYSGLFDHIRTQSATPIAGLANRTFGILAVFWPSKRFTDADTIAGGAAAVADGSDAPLGAALDNLSDVFAARGMTAELTEAKGLVVNLDDDAVAQDRFVAILHDVLDPNPEPDAGMDQLRAALGDTAGRDVLRSLQGAVLAGPPPGAAGTGDAGGAADFTSGGAADLGTIFSSIKDAALGLLNVTTYATMKDRAGVVGRVGLGPVLDAQRIAQPDVKLQLAGHSFGGRLVTAATAAAGAPVASLSLLQAAYSHYGFAQDYDGQNHDGFFRDVVASGKVRGPIIITHSVHDQAVGLAYPIVSRLLDQVASAVGDQNDPFGGMGRNGAQKTPEVPDLAALLQAAGGHYALRNRVPNNLCGDAFIQNHGDICRDEVAYAMLTAVGQT
jgi:hypothetical protein